jgi:nicotinamide N-methyltransferase
MLAHLVQVDYQTQSSLDPEDILSSSLNNLFTDDTRNQYGDSTAKIIYESIYGNLVFRCADVAKEDQGKFADSLWNAGILMGEFLGGKHLDVRQSWPDGKDWWLSDDEQKAWSVRGEKVLELGAGELSKEGTNIHVG